AIVDHGKLMALDSPIRLKAAIPGENTLEASFSTVPPGWAGRLRSLPGVVSVEGEAPVFRIESTSGPETTMALMTTAAAAGVTVHSLSVQSTSLDDVFVHYTGHQLRDALQEPAAADRHVMLRRRGYRAAHLGHHRARSKAVPAQPRAHRHVAAHAGGAARGAGLRLRRQREAPQGGTRGSGRWRAGSAPPRAGQRCGGERADLHDHSLCGPRPGAHRAP